MSRRDTKPDNVVHLVRRVTLGELDAEPDFVFVCDIAEPFEPAPGRVLPDGSRVRASTLEDALDEVLDAVPPELEGEPACRRCAHHSNQYHCDRC